MKQGVLRSVCARAVQKRSRRQVGFDCASGVCTVCWFAYVSDAWKSLRKMPDATQLITARPHGAVNAGSNALHGKLCVHLGMAAA